MNGYVIAGCIALSFTFAAWYLTMVIFFQLQKILDDWRENR